MFCNVLDRMTTMMPFGLAAAGVLALLGLDVGADAVSLPFAAASLALAPSAAITRFGAGDDGEPPADDPWRVVPFEGAFELSYCDAAGNWSVRRMVSREIKIGPGKVLLGGLDMGSGEYRGFRADRIVRLYDADTGQVVDRNVVDWLIKRATAKRGQKRLEAPTD